MKKELTEEGHELRDALEIGALMFGEETLMSVLAGALDKRRDEILLKHPNSVAADILNGEYDD